MDWNQRYLTNDTPWERGEPAPPLVEYLKTRRLRGRILAPGCGTGHDVRLIAACGCETVGVDISEAALSRAAAFSTPANARISYLLADFLDPSSGIASESFDCVFEHTCFCAIDPSRRPDYVASAARVLKPGGELLAILFTDMEDEDGPPFSISRDAIDDLFSPQFVIVDEWRPRLVFPGREGEETMFLMRKR